MRIKKNGKVVRLTESDLQRIVKKVLNESNKFYNDCSECVKNILPRKFRSLSTEIESYLSKDTGGDKEINDIIMSLTEVDPNFDKQILADLYDECRVCLADYQKDDESDEWGI
jgi:hypothetical protein